MTPAPATAPATPDYALMWSLLTEKVIPDKLAELTALLTVEGIDRASDLEVQETATLATIRGCLKPTGQKLFSKALGMQMQQ